MTSAPLAAHGDCQSGCHPHRSGNRSKAGPKSKLGVAPVENTQVLFAIEDNTGCEKGPRDQQVRRHLPQQCSAPPCKCRSSRDCRRQCEKRPRNSSRRDDTHPKAAKQEHEQSPKCEKCARALHFGERKRPATRRQPLRTETKTRSARSLRRRLARKISSLLRTPAKNLKGRVRTVLADHVDTEVRNHDPSAIAGFNLNVTPNQTG